MERVVKVEAEEVPEQLTKLGSENTWLLKYCLNILKRSCSKEQAAVNQLQLHDQHRPDPDLLLHGGHHVSLHLPDRGHDYLRAADSHS